MRILCAVTFFLIAALDAAAAPVILRVDPSHVFRFGPTRATISGSGFEQPVQVLVGGVPATVHLVTPTAIDVTIHPSTNGEARPHGEEVELRIVQQNGETTQARAIRFVNSAAGAPNYATYLVPFTSEIVPGANGSRWKGELTFYNASPFVLHITGSFADPRFLSPPGAEYVEVPPGGTLTPDIFSVGGSVGTFIHIPRPLDAAAKKSLRVRDISVNAASWGTKIPIVSEEETESHVTLIDIPTDSQYRAMLRIYHWSTITALPSRVTIYSPGRATPVATFDLTSFTPESQELRFDMLPFFPSFSQLDLLTPEVRASGSTIRVEVDNLGSSSAPLPPIWAMVSITNNATQQVTLVTP